MYILYTYRHIIVYVCIDVVYRYYHIFSDTYIYLYVYLLAYVVCIHT